MDEKLYPKLEEMCRLCLKENAGTICIFNNEEASDKYASLSIPTRIMTCTSLEVKSSDAFPKKICTDCRYQLEKSYYFRKLSQSSDNKLRKHIRFIAMGKQSKVFEKNLEEDDFYELEFEDSHNFIRDREDQQKQFQKCEIETLMNELKSQNEKDLAAAKEDIRESCRKDLIPKLREELLHELQIENEEKIRKEITEQCINQAKESLRSEIREECRHLEMKCLLDDLQTYLANKNKTLGTYVPPVLDSLKRPISETTKNDISSKVLFIPHNVEVVRMDLDHSRTEKETVILTENRTDSQNDEDYDSEGNFLIFDTDEVFDDGSKKSLDEKSDYGSNVVQEVEYDDEFVEDNIVTYEKHNSENVETNEESVETTSTTSYQIEDNEDGEIKFLKKSNDDNVDEADPNEKYEFKNVVIINVDDGTETEYVDNFDDVEEKHDEDEKKQVAKTKKSSHKKQKASRVTRTTSLTSETTFLTKTFVNPQQRRTDTPKIFRCVDCPMVFSTKLSLDRHLRTHRKIEKTGVTFQCPECRIVVSCSSALRRHMYVHCEEKPFACNLCDKAFVQKEILKRHMQTHTGIKPHNCPHCERSFAQRINLTQHINRTHLDEPRIQQHSCFLCPKRFNHASGLSRHLATHSGVAFQCSVCDRTFGDRSSIRRHIANMHGDGKPSKDKKELPK